MKAIVARVLPATDTKPARIKVSAEGVKSRTWPYTNHWDIEQRIEEFARSLGWIEKGEKMAHGSMPNGDSVACFLPKRPK